MTTTTVEASIDAHYEGAANPNTNYGTLDFIKLGLTIVDFDKTENWRSIGNFDVSAVGADVVSSAKLVRHITAAIGSMPGRLSRCTRPADWTETGVTWLKYDGTNSWTTGGGDFDDVTPPKIDWTNFAGLGDFEVLGLKPFVDDAIANRNNIVSLILRHQTDTAGASQRREWSSKEKGTNVWRLVIEHAPAGGSAAARMRHRW